jgi:hypothetical protein
VVDRAIIGQRISIHGLDVNRCTSRKRCAVVIANELPQHRDLVGGGLFVYEHYKNNITAEAVF